MAITKIPNKNTGRFAFVATVNYVDADGKRRQAKRSASSMREAKELEAVLLTQRQKKELRGMLATEDKPVSEGVTVREYLQGWLKRQERRANSGEIKATTLERSKSRMALIQAQIGDVPLDKLTTRQVQDAYHAIEDSGRSPTTVLNIHTLFRQALQEAVDIDEILKRNVAIKAISPRPKKYEAKILTRAEISRIFDAADKTDAGPIIRLLAWTGLRLGEAMGLQWSDLDLEGATLTVRRSLNSRRELSTPKTSRSRRRLDLSPDTVSLLREVQRRQAEDRTRAGSTYKDGGDVFTDALGVRRDQGYVERNWQKIRIDAGTPDARLHDLRHAHASHLLAAGWEVSAVAERLGHSQASMTLNVYGHAIPSRSLEMAKSIDSIYGASE